MAAACLGAFITPLFISSGPTVLNCLDLLVGGTDLVIGLMSDPYRAAFTFLVGTISAVVFFWALEYIALDANMGRFLIILFAFVISIVFLFTAPSF